MEQKNQSPWDRDIVKERAQAAQPLDAMFIVVQYNADHHGYPKQQLLTPDDIFKILTNDELNELRRRVDELLADRLYFGKKYWTGTRNHQEIIDEMARRHPGFSLKTYNQALNTGIMWLR